MPLPFLPLVNSNQFPPYLHFRLAPRRFLSTDRYLPFSFPDIPHTPYSVDRCTPSYPLSLLVLDFWLRQGCGCLVLMLLGGKVLLHVPSSPFNPRASCLNTGPISSFPHPLYCQSLENTKAEGTSLVNVLCFGLDFTVLKTSGQSASYMTIVKNNMQCCYLLWLDCEFCDTRCFS